MKNNNRFEFNKKYFTISIYAFFVIILALLFFRIISNWSSTLDFFGSAFNILSPFLIAFLIAYLLLPIINWVEKNIVSKLKLKKHTINNLKIKRVLSILMVYIFLFAFLSLTLIYVIPQITYSINEIIDKLPSYYNEIYYILNRTIENIFEHYPRVDIYTLQHTLNNFIPNIFEEAQNLLPRLFGISLSIVSGFINILLAFVISFYLLTEKEAFILKSKKVIFAFLPPNQAKNTIDILKNCHRIFSRFVIGKALDSLIIGILCFVVLFIFRIPYALLLSFIIGITNMIPYFGPFIGAIPGVLILLIINPMQAFWFALIILALQQFDGLYLGPKILGDSTGLSPFWVIFSIIVGGAIFGVIGMFLGVPVFAVLSYLFDKLINKKLLQKEVTLDHKN
ncbi:putative PurR-regulated permease PerM [Natranaerovirga hydrolytica]|uniref:Putative PurR-regulated permease PerM n=1 Tax=Natranaerovirga hydrolytica TaxID=680378 RepID=A0A4V2PYP2_9FIRM|nr:AI-2E family transporter [Natranaerovirga hydrolytica]TCK86761.1 putative PurR-regulated permease PerM [Natranaerovirga hydrolytica]